MIGLSAITPGVAKTALLFVLPACITSSCIRSGEQMTRAVHIVTHVSTPVMVYGVGLFVVQVSAALFAYDVHLFDAHLSSATTSMIAVSLLHRRLLYISMCS